MSKNKTQKSLTSETKEQKFVRIVPKRVNTALDKIRLIKNVFASKQYAMNEEQMNLVLSTLETAVMEIRTAYEGRTKSKQDVKEFTL